MFKTFDGKEYLLMKIAFDVKGTLDGPRHHLVLKIFLALQNAGHEMYVWSNAYPFAVEAVKEYGLKAQAISKFSKSDREDAELMDLAIEDDTSQTYLGAKEIIFVHELRDKIEFLKQLSGGKLK